MSLASERRPDETVQLVGDRTMTDDQLVELLLDPDRFAAAHVVLTMRRNALTSFDASQWNGLRVVLGPAGTARYDHDDMATLHERWLTAVRRWLRERAALARWADHSAPAFTRTLPELGACSTATQPVLAGPSSSKIMVAEGRFELPAKGL